MTSRQQRGLIASPRQATRTSPNATASADEAGAAGVAVYLLAIGVKGLQLAGAPVYVNNLFNGSALIIAVALAHRSGDRSHA